MLLNQQKNPKLLLKVFHSLVKNFEEIASGFFLLITVGTVIANVVLRYLLNRGFFWAEEVSTISFIWCIYLGAAAAYKAKLHIGIDLLQRLLPAKLQVLVTILTSLMMLCISGLILYYSFIFIQSNMLKSTPVLNIPSLYVNSALTLGFALIFIHALIFMLRDILRITK